MSEPTTVKIQVRRDDSISGGFAAYLAPSLSREGEGIVLLNVEATFHAAAANQENPIDFLIENIMHEVGHAMKDFFGQEFNEERIEGIVEKYRERYMSNDPASGASREMFIVGQFKAVTPDGVVWEFQGVFSSRDAAIAACRTETYFYFPIIEGQELPHETIINDRTVYPHAATDSRQS